MMKTTYLLVHGAFHGSWCWRDVVSELAARDEAVATIDLPSSIHGADPHTYLIDDARAVAALANELGAVTLVGHSYGGAVIAEAAELIDDLRGLIFIAGLVPSPNESASEAYAHVEITTQLDKAIRREDDYFVVEPTAAAEALAQDCPLGVRNFIAEHLSSQTVASYVSPRENGDTEAWRRYILCEFDEAFDPAAQIAMADRCDEIFTLPSGHSPFFSQPHTLVDTLLA